MSLKQKRREFLSRIEADKNNLPTLPQKLSKDREFILRALKITLNIWPQVSPKLRSNKQFMSRAIEQDSSAFRYASEQLRDDEEFALAAIRKDNSLLYYASDRLKTDESFKNRATKINSWFPIIRFNKLLKNNFYEGVWDSFAIMYGDHGLLLKYNGSELSSNQYKYGVVDLTLIPWLSNVLINYALPTKLRAEHPYRYLKDEVSPYRPAVLRGAALGIGLALQALRLGLAILASLLVMPIIACVHIIKYPYVAYKQHQLYALEGEIYQHPDQEPLKKTTLGEFAKQTNSSLTDFCAVNLSKAQEHDITTVASQNIETHSYGSLRGYSTLLFFRPSTNGSKTQQAGLQVLDNLEINNTYDPNDFEDNAIGRSFI